MNTTTQIGVIMFGAIKNVRKSGDEEGVYFANVELSPSEGFPMEWNLYCARSDDYAPTGKWVYDQIIKGNFEGKITQLPPTPIQEFAQPISQGTQTL